jgi:hypothetical protein
MIRTREKWPGPNLTPRFQGKNLANLLRDLVRDFLEEFSYADFKVALTKTQGIMLQIKQLTALGHVIKSPMQAQKGGSDVLNAQERQPAPPYPHRRKIVSSQAYCWIFTFLVLISRFIVAIPSLYGGQS